MANELTLRDGLQIESLGLGSVYDKILVIDSEGIVKYRDTSETSLDNRYVSITGDTMTGTLKLNDGPTSLIFPESGVNKWHLESVGGVLKIVQTGVAERFNIDSNGNVRVFQNLTANSFIKTGGTASQFLKADGSVDNNTYLTSLPTHNHDTIYVKKSGDTMTGDLNLSSVSALNFSSYGGGWYMSDATWIRTVGNKSIYQNTGNMRTDGTLQVGSGGAKMNVPSGGTPTIDGSTIYHAGNLTNVSQLTNDAGYLTSAPDPTSLLAIDDRDIKPNALGGLNQKQVRAYFTSLGGLTSTDDGDFQDLLVMDTYGDATGGDINALAFDKSIKRIRHYLAEPTATTWGVPETIAYLSDITGSTDSLQDVMNRGKTSTIPLYISGYTDSNVAPATDQIKVDGYGIIGNRADFYITNNGSNIKFGVGGIHNTGVKMAIGTNTVIYNSLYVKNIFPEGSDGLSLYGDNNDGSGRGANISISGNASPYVNVTIGDTNTTLAGQFNVSNRSTTTLGSALFDKIGDFKINSNGAGSIYHQFTDSYYRFSSTDTLPSRTQIGLGEVLMYGGSGGNHHFFLKQLGSMTSLIQTDTGIDIRTGGVSGPLTTIDTLGKLTATSLAIIGGTSDDVLLGDGTTTSLSGISATGDYVPMTRSVGYTTSHSSVSNNGAFTGMYYSSTSSQNQPPVGNSHILSQSVNSQYTQQIGGRDNRLFFRHQEGGVWGTWKEFATREWVMAQDFGSGAGTEIGSNLASGILPTGTSVVDGSYATDGGYVTQNYTGFGNAGTQSTSGTETEYIQIDLGAVYNCIENRIWFYDLYDRYYWYNLQYSEDGTNWLYAVGSSGTFIASDGIVDQPDVVNIGPVSARYWRIYANGNSSNDGNHLYEWEIYEGTGGSGGAYLPLSGGTLTGPLELDSYGSGVTQFKIGTMDGASYSNYNVQLAGHYGLGMTYGGVAKGYYDFRSGTWDTKGGFKVDGNPVATQSWVTAQGYGSPTYNYFGIENTSNTSGYGLSLYGGPEPGIPKYGLLFSGTPTFGTHGGVTGDWATYFTMTESGTTKNRGWVFKHNTTNVASISGSGIATFNGNVNAPDFVGTSDERLKENIRDFNPIKIKGDYKTFNFKGDKQLRIGKIAQELELTNPEFIRTDNEGFKSISYIDLHSAEIAYLKVQNELKDKKIEQLEERLLRIEKLLNNGGNNE